MRGKVNDVAKAQELDKRMADSMPEDFRPDMIGGTSGYNDSGDSPSTMYFTTEAEARKGEKEMERGARCPRWPNGVEIVDGEVQYFDLTDPQYI